MAIGDKTDFKLNNEQFQTGLREQITQNVNAFNEQSKGSLVIVTEDHTGDYIKDAFFKDIGGLIGHRDPTDVSAATDLKLEQEEEIGIRVPRRIGPVATTLDSLLRIASSESEISLLLGQGVADRKFQNHLNTMILAVEAAQQNASSLEWDQTGESTKTMGSKALNKGLSLMGDQAERVVCWVMHSKVYYDLVGDQIDLKVTNISDRVIAGAMPASFNRPIIVTDSPALLTSVSGGNDTYITLGLVAGACTLKESGQQPIVSRVVDGLKNLVFRWQSEYSMFLNVKGSAFDTASLDPIDSVLGDNSKWSIVVGSDKLTAGVRIKTE